MKIRIYFLIVLMFLMAGINSCKKSDTANPYDDPSLKAPAKNTNLSSIPSDNFAYLHEKIFGATCANSGCHDGNFEPDFRTINSAYNSLVYHPVISNDPANSYQYRVVPGNADKSLLYIRLTQFLPNSSGTMPLSVNPGSDWPSKHDVYVQNIKDWINAGAKDMFGNAPVPGDIQPQVDGLLAFSSGSTLTPYPRGSGAGVQPIEIPSGTNVDFWFAASDDKTSPQNLQVNEFKLSTDPFIFSGIVAQGLTFVSSPLPANGFKGQAVLYTHRVTTALNYPAGTDLFIRVYFSDGTQPQTTEIPNNGTNSETREYFHIKIK